MVMENRRIAIREVTEKFNISLGLCHIIFSDIFGYESCSSEVRYKTAKFSLK